MPVGKGRSRWLRNVGKSYKDFVTQSQGIILINNDDNMCFVRAVVISKAMNDGDIEFDRMVKGLSAVLDQRVTEICEYCDIDTTRGCGLTEIKKVQDYLGDAYSIVGYSDRFGKTTLFTGPQGPDKKRLNLYFENDHFDVIQSLTATFACSYYCEMCHFRYNNKVEHKKCPYTCPCCHTQPPCRVDFQNIRCNECLRDFRGDECFRLHKDSGLCARMKRCGKCCASYWIKKKHLCGQKYCRTCNAVKPVRHLCFMPVNSRQPNREQFLLIFYDFEAMQGNLRSDNENVFLHEVNLCVAQQACQSYIASDNIENIYSICGERQHIFYAENPVANFLEYVSKVPHKFKSVVLLAHNMKSYDGHFILKEMLQEEQRWKPKIIFSGHKILSITCGRFKFLDSLNYLPTSLAKLPKMFNFPESKGYFPHLFNTPENQNYVGPLLTKIT